MEVSDYIRCHIIIRIKIKKGYGSFIYTNCSSFSSKFTFTLRNLMEFAVGNSSSGIYTFQNIGVLGGEKVADEEKNKKK